MLLNVMSSGESTYWATDRLTIPDIIDFGVIKIEASLALFSDHLPIIVYISNKQNVSPTRSTKGRRGRACDAYAILTKSRLKHDLLHDF